jgi:hypothetical protein
MSKGDISSTALEGIWSNRVAGSTRASVDGSIFRGVPVAAGRSGGPAVGVTTTAGAERSSGGKVFVMDGSRLRYEPGR